MTPSGIRAHAFAALFLVTGCAGRTSPLLGNAGADGAVDDTTIDTSFSDGSSDDVLPTFDAGFDAGFDVADEPTVSLVDLTLPVGASNDDALQDPDGTVLVSYRWISLYSPAHRGGLRFALRDLPRSAVLVEAYLEAYVDSDAEGNPSETIYLENRPNPPAFVAARNDVGRRARTTRSVSWVASSIGMGWARSPSLVPLLQPVVDGPTFAPGDAVVFLFVPNPDVGPGRIFEVRQFDYGKDFGARLVLRYRPR